MYDRYSAKYKIYCLVNIKFVSCYSTLASIVYTITSFYISYIIESARDNWLSASARDNWCDICCARCGADEESILTMYFLNILQHYRFGRYPRYHQIPLSFQHDLFLQIWIIFSGEFLRS